MKIVTTLATIILSISSGFGQNKAIDEIFSKKIEHGLISRGNNFPDFDPKKDSADLFLFSLHKKIPVSEFKKKANYDDSQIDQIVTRLISKGWLVNHDYQLKPTVFIADKVDGNKLYKKAEPIAKEISQSIKKIAPAIRKEFNKTEISKKDKFEKWSFLILSNVLLDSWQIDYVEREYLKKSNRPARHGKNYYYKISESTSESIESFGIYGNQYQTIKGRNVSIYGNNRIKLNVEQSENFISKSDNKIFGNMAKMYLPKLLQILINYKPYSFKVYDQLGYKNEITYEEFFIWWYHFIYTKATDQMNRKNVLVIPKSGNFDFEIGR
jgi:hypothetical protein